MRVLLIEDDATTRKAIAELLRAYHFIVDVAENGALGWEMTQRLDYDLILLDIVLPGLNGITLCRRLRQQQQTVPIVFLTSCSTLSDKLEGLNAGADDYIIKSSDPQELVARIQASLRRGCHNPEFILRWGNLALDPKTRSVTYSQQALSFSRKEFQILELLIRHPNWVLSRQTIIDQVWGVGEDPPSESTVKSHIKAIRRKFKALTDDSVIETVYGQGYRLNATAAQATQTAPDGASAIANPSIYPFEPHTPAKPDHLEQPADPLHQSALADVTQTLHPSTDSQQNPSHPAPPTSILSSAKRQQLQANLNQLWHQAKQTAWQRLNTIEQLLYFLQTGLPNQELLDQIRYIAHKLAGSLGTFGQVESSQAAYQLERLVQSAAATLFPLDSATRDRPPNRAAQHMSHSAEPDLDLIAAAQQLIQLIRTDLDREASLNAAVQALPPLPHQPPQQPCLLIVDADVDRVQPIVNAAADWSMRAAIASDLATAQAAISQQQADIILLDLGNHPNTLNGLQFLRHLYDQANSIPVVVYASGLTKTDRLQAIRLGAVAFVPRPAVPEKILSIVQQHLPHPEPNFHVLAVDDDEQQLVTLQTYIEKEGLQFTGLGQPERLLETLQVHQPDLVLLDILMPKISGIELCQILRSDAEYQTLPVMMLTHYDDLSTRQRALWVGADAVLSKHDPISATLSRIQARLYRDRRFSPAHLTDPLTGLMNRSGATRAFQQLIAIARQFKQPLSLGVINLDNLQRFNAEYGRAAGDQLLRQFIAFLRQQCPSTDVVARWRAEEFVISMIGVERAAAVEHLAQLLERWRSQPHTDATTDAATDIATDIARDYQSQPSVEHPPNDASGHGLNGNEPPMLSFSAGVATYPDDGHNLEFLYRVADAALYQAKLTGRDRILPASWQMPNTSHPWIDVAVIGTDTDWLRSLVRALETRGYCIHWSQSGQSALDYLNPDLAQTVVPHIKTILLDTHLPDMSATELAPQLHQVCQPKKTIIALIHQDNPDQVETLRSQGITNSVSLPCDLTTVIDQIRLSLHHQTTSG